MTELIARLRRIACWFGWHKDTEDFLQDDDRLVRVLRTCRNCARSTIVSSCPFEGRF